FFCPILRPLRSTLFPYTTLFRSLSGLSAIWTLNPGLAPWAVLLDPFRVLGFAPETNLTSLCRNYGDVVFWCCLPMGGPPRSRTEHPPVRRSPPERQTRISETTRAGN